MRPEDVVEDRRYVPAVSGSTSAVALAVAAVVLLVDGVDPVAHAAAAGAVVTHLVYDYWSAARQARARRTRDAATARRLAAVGNADLRGTGLTATLALVAAGGLLLALGAGERLTLSPAAAGTGGLVVAVIAAVDLLVLLLRDPVLAFQVAVRRQRSAGDHPRSGSAPRTRAAAVSAAADRLEDPPRYGVRVSGRDGQRA